MRERGKKRAGREGKGSERRSAGSLGRENPAGKRGYSAGEGLELWVMPSGLGCELGCEMLQDRGTELEQEAQTAGGGHTAEQGTQSLGNWE